MRNAGFSDRLKAARKDAGKTQRQLSIELGLSNSPGNISRLEGGDVPRIDTVDRLAVLLDVCPGWLAFGIGPMAEWRERFGVNKDEVNDVD